MTRIDYQAERRATSSTVTASQKAIEKPGVLAVGDTGIDGEDIILESARADINGIQKEIEVRWYHFEDASTLFASNMRMSLKYPGTTVY